jgi:hypothetical protein
VRIILTSLPQGLRNVLGGYMFEPMDNAKMGEIALKVLKHQVRQKGIRFPKDAKREINQEAQNLGIKPEEAKQFIETIHRELFAEMYPEK